MDSNESVCINAEALAALLVPCAECKDSPEMPGMVFVGYWMKCPACRGARYPALLRHLSEQEERLTIQDRIGKWAHATFGAATSEVCIRRLDEEFYEFCQDPCPGEAADIVVTLMRYCFDQGYDLLAATEEKFAKLLKRRWVQHGDGTGHRADSEQKQALGFQARITELQVALKEAAVLVAGSFVFVDRAEEQAERIKELEREQDGLLERKKDLSFIGEQTGFGDHIIVGVAELRERIKELERVESSHRGALREICTTVDPTGDGETHVDEILACIRAGAQSLVDSAELRDRLARAESRLSYVVLNRWIVEYNEINRKWYCHRDHYPALGAGASSQEAIDAAIAKSQPQERSNA